MIKTLLTATLAAACLAQGAAAQVSFEQIAPENSIFVAGVRNASTTLARFERTALYSLWRSDEMQELRREMTDGFEGDLREALDELGLNREDFVWPTGSVGLSVFAVIDPEIGLPSPAFVLFADYGDRADRFQRLVDAMLERGREDGELEIEERDIMERTVFSITMPRDDQDDWEADDEDWGFDDEDEGEADDEDDWGFDDEDDWGFDDDPLGIGESLDVFRTLHMVREGNAFILCSDLGSITEVLDRIVNSRDGGLTERADYRTSLDMIGAGDAYAMVLTRDMGQLVQAFDQTGMSMMITPMVKGLFGEIASMATGVQLDAPEAMVRSNMAIAMPRGKRGLTALMDVSKPRGPLPVFVGEGAYSYTTLNFNFGGIPDAAHRFVQENPMMAMMGAGETLAQVDPIMRPLFDAMGDRLHMVGKLNRPISLQSNQTLFAMEATDPAQFDSIISGFAAEQGLESRDVNGHRLYSGGMPGMMMPGMPEMAMGIGERHIFLGAVNAVEQALGGGDNGGDGLGQDPQFAAAVAHIPDVPLVSWGYADLVTTIEATLESQRLMMEQMQQDFPWMEEIEEGDDPFAEFAEKIDYELLRRYIGPSVTWMRSTEAGFVGTTLYFEAQEQSREQR